MFMKLIWGPALGLILITSFGLVLSIPAKSEPLAADLVQDEGETREEEREERKVVINRHGGSFEDMDLDGDGRLSREEFLKDNNRSRVFDEMDNDDDEYVTEDEIEAFADARVEKAMARMKERFAEQGLWDEETDSVNVDEMVERHMKRAERAMERAEEAVHRSERVIEMRFRNMDEDGDGEITLGEMGMDPARIGRHLVMTDMVMENRFESLDADEDGVLSEEEFLSRRKEMFSELDENGDGALSEEEMETAMAERMRIRVPGVVRMRHMHRDRDHHQQNGGDEDNNK